MPFVRSDFATPPKRTAMAAPAAGQNLAETTANASSATRPSSPEVSPNMSPRLTQPHRLRKRSVNASASLFSPPPSGYCGVEPMSDDLLHRYVIGLGANLGDRRGSLRAAVLALGAHGRVLGVSHLYETPALGPPQPDYLNAAVLLECRLAPQALLGKLFEVEQAHGRERRERWGPRTLDLDLLCSPGQALLEPGLSLPHPELERRAFALTPLLDVMPDARAERSGASYRSVLATLERSPVRLVETSEAWDPRADAAGASGRAE